MKKHGGGVLLHVKLESVTIFVLPRGASKMYMSHMSRMSHMSHISRMSHMWYCGNITRSLRTRSLGVTSRYELYFYSAFRSEKGEKDLYLNAPLVMQNVRIFYCGVFISSM